MEVGYRKQNCLLTLRTARPCSMVSGFTMKAATLVMMSVQSSQVQSPRPLFTFEFFVVQEMCKCCAMVVEVLCN